MTEDRRYIMPEEMNQKAEKLRDMISTFGNDAIHGTYVRLIGEDYRIAVTFKEGYNTPENRQTVDQMAKEIEAGEIWYSNFSPHP